MVEKLDGVLDELLCDKVDTPAEAVDQSNKRQYLKNLINQGKSDLFPGKTPWTIERLDKASDNVINKLYGNLSSKSEKQKDMLSRISGVDDVNSMMKDINSNYLIKNSASEMMGNLTNKVSFSSHTPMEILDSHLYEKYGMYMAPLSLFCTVFNHLDWESFARIAEERKLLSDSGDVTNEF